MLYTLLVTFFSLGYLAIIFENILHMNKAAIAVLMGVVCWLFYFLYLPQGVAFTEQLSGIAEIIFFLLAVMTIVQVIDAHHGFKIVTNFLHTSSQRKMLWILIGLSFFMSAVLDNLTTMIVMVSLLKQLIQDKRDRWVLGSILVIVVNAGGAWTPIGDVTTTMLWIHGKITTWAIIKTLFVPSVVCALVAGIMGTFLVHGKTERKELSRLSRMAPGARSVFCMGVSALILIPVWKALFGLPPFMGALIGLGVLWLITDILHFGHGEKRWHLRMSHILTTIDTQVIFFFLGILLAVDALSMAGVLTDLATWLQQVVPNQTVIVTLIGLISSIVDNVPLVAASMEMYKQYPIDSSLWELIAYAAGTGGSILIIGSAAGVAFMGLEKVDFMWYFKQITWIALLSYFAGIGVYLIL